MTTDELKPCPMCGGSPNKPAKNGGSDERSGYNFTVTVACKCGLRIDRASHQGKQGWCDDSGQAEAEAIAAWNSRAQPAAPAVCPSCDGTGKISGLPCAWCMRSAAPADAAPSVAPEPVAWQMIDKHGDTVYVPVTHAIKPDLVLDCDLRHPDNAPHEQRPLFAHPPRAPLQDEHPYTYASTQATNCAGCGEYKHTPLRIDAMGGYVCLTCIDGKLGTLLGEFGYPPRAPLTEEQRRDLVKECGLDWQRGYMPLFEGDPTNRYAVLVEAVEAAHGIGGK
jgi:hypothetical protein